MGADLLHVSMRASRVSGQTNAHPEKIRAVHQCAKRERCVSELDRIKK